MDDKRKTDAACDEEALRAEESAEDRRGDQAGDAQRGGRLPTADGDDDREPRPADEAARSGIPSRSFNL
jgi:hypothetical protein